MPGDGFGFVQLEVPWPLGPADGRYVVRRHAGEAPDHVLVLATLGAPERRRLRGRRPSAAAPEPAPAPVSTGRATVIDTAPLGGPRAAEEWLRSTDLEAQAASALTILNGALHAHRVASADPYVREACRADLLALRVGWGPGEQVAEGRWVAARDVPPPRGRRRGEASLRPQERLSALLGGRDAALAAEELTLRARADLDAGRPREAALQLRVALEAALSELEAWRARGGLAARLDALAGERPAVGAAANAALAGGLADAQTADVARALARVESALRARTAAGLE